MPPHALVLDTQPLTIDDVHDVARSARRVEVGDRARAAMVAARQVIEDRARGSAPVYGVNTGFGSLSGLRIEPGEVRAVQRNLLRSHAAGVGDDLSGEVVRGMMVILAASLARGHSGARPGIVELLTDLLAHDITPIIPSRGSVGASGDLAPLAHLALVLIGEGEAQVGDARMPGSAALATANLAPVTLEANEGLSLINGTHMMASLGALALADVRRLVPAALCAAAMAFDACRGTDTPLDARLHEVRRQAGQVEVARHLRTLIAGSGILTAHRQDDPRVQDPYCLRAAPQVMGAALDAIGFVETIISRELGAVSDNPLVFADAGDVVSGANFHGMPLAIALDVLTTALCPLAGIAERRVYWLLKASDEENPVNAYLSPQPGLHSGLMITQYTAAACCNELQTLAVPASVANISTSAGIEDYNSMGATSAHQARAAVALARNVVAIELLVMAEALEYQRPLRSGDGVEAAHDVVRRAVPRLTEDRPPAPDIAAIADLIAGGAFDEIVASA